MKTFLKFTVLSFLQSLRLIFSHFSEVRPCQNDECDVTVLLNRMMSLAINIIIAKPVSLFTVFLFPASPLGFAKRVFFFPSILEFVIC